jgi:4-phosphopantoate--beta-alanine ligase
MISKRHPRYASLTLRECIEAGLKHGITSLNGLIAHGRGEAFDYLLSEKTHFFAVEAIRAAARLLLEAKHPVISVNGNTAALVPKEMVRLSKLLTAPLEINLFHPSRNRVQKIQKHLQRYGAKNILLPEESVNIPNVHSKRKFVNEKGIYGADVIFVPLEDGDRTEALVKEGRKVITVDLNPLSRTAKYATVTIVDNIVRCLPLLSQEIELQKNHATRGPKRTMWRYSNTEILSEAEKMVRQSNN